MVDDLSTRQSAEECKRTPGQVERAMIFHCLGRHDCIEEDCFSIGQADDGRSEKTAQLVDEETLCPVVV